ncbi:MAG: nucleoside phosphorylase [Abditibacteriales bacterium]|nr:nucleoside phosphorylase [Abditibacteriales bacterium]MDW8365098.1 nucleoside phosphorylase [Abditibacteriales bacterium]
MMDWYTNIPNDEPCITARGFWDWVRRHRTMDLPRIGGRDVVLGFLTLEPVADRCAERWGAEKVPRQIWSANLYALPTGRGSIWIYTAGVGAPLTIGKMEMLIGLGAERFIFVGYGGALQGNLNVGDCVIPTAAIREEGTSYHYAPPSAEPVPTERMVDLLTHVAIQRGVAVRRGTVWSTDAVFRELKSKVRKFQNHGVLAVDMETSAIFTVGMYYGVDTAVLLTISDSLANEQHEFFFATPEFEKRAQLSYEIVLEVARRIVNG